MQARHSLKLSRSTALAAGAPSPGTAGPTVGARPRYPLFDALRGVAIAMMFVYHFCFDLNYFVAIQQDFNHDPFWLGLRAVIVSSFLALVGVSLVLAGSGAAGRRGRWMRLARVAGCAALVSLGSRLMFPDSMIFFGILHFITVASLLGRAMLPLGLLTLPLGAAVIAGGLNYSHPWFDQHGWQWIGLVTAKPITEDYVPLVPWFGVVLIGIGLCTWLARRPGRLAFAAGLPGGAVGRVLACAGRHSLILYMLHQPLFIGALSLVFRVLRGPAA
jgi:uncharacterized membrane protein